MPGSPASKRAPPGGRREGVGGRDRRLGAAPSRQEGVEGTHRGAGCHCGGDVVAALTHEAVYLGGADSVTTNGTKASRRKLGVSGMTPSSSLGSKGSLQ